MTIWYAQTSGAAYSVQTWNDAADGSGSSGTPADGDTAVGNGMGVILDVDVSGTLGVSLQPSAPFDFIVAANLAMAGNLSLIPTSTGAIQIASSTTLSIAGTLTVPVAVNSGQWLIQGIDSSSTLTVGNCSVAVGGDSQNFFYTGTFNCPGTMTITGGGGGGGGGSYLFAIATYTIGTLALLGSPVYFNTTGANGTIGELTASVGGGASPSTIYDASSVSHAAPGTLDSAGAFHSGGVIDSAGAYSSDGMLIAGARTAANTWTANSALVSVIYDSSGTATAGNGVLSSGTRSSLTNWVQKSAITLPAVQYVLPTSAGGPATWGYSGNTLGPGTASGGGGSIFQSTFFVEQGFPMKTISIPINFSIAGRNFDGSIQEQSPGEEGNDFDLPAAQAGSVTTHTSSTAGVVTTTADLVGIVTNDKVDVYTAAGVRYGMTATVAGNAVTLSGGAGIDFPAGSTAVMIAKQLVGVIEFKGTETNLLAIVADQPTSVVFCDSEDATISAWALNAGGLEFWNLHSGATNPLTADVASIKYSGGGAAGKLTIGAAFNNT